MNRRYVSIMLICCLGGLLGVVGCCVSFCCGAKEKYDRTEQLSAAMAGIEKLQADTSFGSITIKGSDTAECSVRADITGHAPTREQAQELAEQTKITLEPQGTTLNVKIRKPTMGSNCSVAVAFDITLPVSTSIECSTSFGSIEVTNVKGDVQTKTSSGSIIAANIEGCLDLTTSFGSVTCSDTSGGSLHVVSSSGNISIENAAFGSCDARTSFGRVTCSNVAGGPLRCKSDSGNISVVNSANTNVDVSTSFGRISCESIAARMLDAVSSSGNIKVVYSASAPAEITARVSTSFGNIDFTAPPEFAGTVMMRTDFGSVKTDLPVTIKGDIDPKHIEGTVAAGAGRVELKTSSGSIKLR